MQREGVSEQGEGAERPGWGIWWRQQTSASGSESACIARGSGKWRCPSEGHGRECGLRPSDQCVLPLRGSSPLSSLDLSLFRLLPLHNILLFSLFSITLPPFFVVMLFYFIIYFINFINFFSSSYSSRSHTRYFFTPLRSILVVRTERGTSHSPTRARGMHRIDCPRTGRRNDARGLSLRLSLFLSFSSPSYLGPLFISAGDSPLSPAVHAFSHT